MVFRATKKSMLKVIQAKKETHAPVSGTNILETWDLSKMSRANLRKLKCYLNKRSDWEHMHVTVPSNSKTKRIAFLQIFVLLFTLSIHVSIKIWLAKELI